MRKKIVAGNWKCNTTVQEGVELAKEVSELVAKSGVKNVVVVLGTPFTHITSVVGAVDSQLIDAIIENAIFPFQGSLFINFPGTFRMISISQTDVFPLVVGKIEVIFPQRRLDPVGYFDH